jgi:hypothetical protein
VTPACCRRLACIARLQVSSQKSLGTAETVGRGWTVELETDATSGSDTMLPEADVTAGLAVAMEEAVL